MPSTPRDNYNLVEALVSRILFSLVTGFNILGLWLFPITAFVWQLFDLTTFHIDFTDIDEKQLVLYAQMANLVNLILQWPDINTKEIAENFSKVSSQVFRAEYYLQYHSHYLWFLLEHFVYLKC